MTRPFIVGLGSHHGDDQAGWLVLEQLQARGYPVSQLARLQHPAQLLDVIVGESTVVPGALVGWDQRRFAAPAHHPVAATTNGGPALEASLSHPTQRTAASQPPGLRDVRSAERPDYGRALVICDACVGDDPPGTIHSFRWPTDKIIYPRPSGSHDLSLADVLELGQQLGSLPVTVQIWTVQAGSWSAGSEPSLEVQSAAASVADAIWKDQQRA